MMLAHMMLESATPHIGAIFCAKVVIVTSPAFWSHPDCQGHKGAGKKKGGEGGGGGSLDWGAEFGHLVKILHQLLQLDLQQLWDPPSVTVMEDFTKLVVLDPYVCLPPASHPCVPGPPT